MDRRTDCAVRAAEAGAETAAESFRTDLAVETKGEKTDVVTEADRAAQRRVIDVIEAAFESEPIVGEEDDAPGAVPEEGPGWIVDPIDGTANFVRGVGVWTTSVAATIDGEPVGGATVAPGVGDTFRLEGGEAFRNGRELSVSDRADPETFVVVPTMWWDPERRGEYAAACRGIVERFGDMRRFGSAQFELALCAAGAVEAVVTNLQGYPWDTVLGAGLVEAAGGTVTDVHGDPWRHDSRGLVASNGRAHEAVLETVREIEAADR
jgi:myo-inositol-1(or 4)-monophosphatase